MAERSNLTRLLAMSISALLTFVLTTNTIAAEMTELHIGRDQVSSAETDIAIAVLKVAYAKLGIKPVFVSYPLRRSLALANSGRLDGDTMRYDQAFQDTPNLIEVQVPVVQVRWIAFMRPPCPARISWEDLNNHVTSYERGIKFLEQRLGYQSAVLTDTPADALRMLSKGLSDAAVSAEFEAEAVLRKNPLSNVCKVDQALETTLLFHALHKRHSDLAAQLEKTLRDMQNSGEIQAIWKSAN